jgi:hypothetical protein
MIKRPSSRAINQQPPSPAETEQPVSDKRSEIERFKRQSRSFSLSLQGLSRKATYKADAREYTDIDWVPLSLAATTAEFNETTLPLVQSHATLARLRSGAGENKAQEKKAVKEMLAAREQIYLNWLGQYAYFYVGPPRYEPLPAMLGVWVMTNERDEQLRWLAGYKTTDQAERSVLEEFSTGHLGTGGEGLDRDKVRKAEGAGKRTSWLRVAIRGTGDRPEPADGMRPRLDKGRHAKSRRVRPRPPARPPQRSQELTREPPVLDKGHVLEDAAQGHGRGRYPRPEPVGVEAGALPGEGRPLVVREAGQRRGFVGSRGRLGPPVLVLGHGPARYRRAAIASTCFQPQNGGSRAHPR